MLVEIETTSRWDALALTRSLDRYRWYLVAPDSRHWDVCVRVDEAEALPDALRETIERWLAERGYGAATVHAGDRVYEVERSSSGT